MKLYNIKDVSGLFAVLDNAQDRVVVETSDGSRLDWTTQKQALKSLASSMEGAGLRDLALTFRSSRDADSVISFLMGCRRPASRTA